MHGVWLISARLWWATSVVKEKLRVPDEVKQDVLVLAARSAPAVHIDVAFEGFSPPSAFMNTWYSNETVHTDNDVL